jgi:putative ABC transport system permease protein
MKDFHFKGADQQIEPVAFALADTNFLSYILIRVTPGKTQESLKAVDRIWKEIIPEYPLQYSFIDQDYDHLFRAQIRLTSLLKYFTFLSLIIACLGLYGLSAYSTERRTNEIGIRKVMGADSFAVIYSMSKEFMLLIGISIIIALPVGWIVVNNLLKQFPYRIEVHVPIFIALALGAMTLAILTVSFQAFKATRVNPVEALKIE